MGRRRYRGDAGAGEAGFALVEQVIAVALVVMTLIALLTVLGSGSRGVVNGRQRTVATSLGRQALERLQGGAYADVAMDLSSLGLADDARVTGTLPVLEFEGEQLIGGASAPYQVEEVAAGVRYTISTFITAVVPAAGLPYRRVTVFVEWTPSLSGSFHSQRFSTLVYPLDYHSYPAGSGHAEVGGGGVSVTGFLGADVFEHAEMRLPTSRAKTTASTLRTAQGAASSSTAILDFAESIPSSTTCTITGFPTHSAQCPVATVTETADNDGGSSSSAWSGTDTALYDGASITTVQGLAWSLPAGTGAAHAAVEDCGGCGYGDGDGTVWADATRTTTGAAEAAFTLDGGLGGRLWHIAAGWRGEATVDHDTSSGERVTSSAQLTAPPAKVFALDGAGAFDAAVLVGDTSGFTATATASAGHGAVAPSATASTVPVRLWDGDLGTYRSVDITPGVAADESASATLVVAGHTVTFTSRVQSAPATSTSDGSTPLAGADSQHPSLLRVTVTVDVVDGGGVLVGRTTVTLDYGQVTAQGTWTAGT